MDGGPGDQVHSVSNGVRHLDNGDRRAADGEELHQVKSRRAAADDDGLFSRHAVGEAAFRHLRDHAVHGHDIAFCKVIQQAGNVWRCDFGTGGADDQIRVFGGGHLLRNSRVQHQSSGTVFQISDEIVHSALSRQIAETGGSSAKAAALLCQCYVASDLRSGTRRFQPGGSSADHHDLAGFIDLALFAGIALGHCRIDRAADRAVAAHPVADAANAAGNTLSQLVFPAVANLIAPFRVCNQRSSHCDDVRVAAGDDVLRDVRVADVAGDDDRLAGLFLHGFG